MPAVCAVNSLEAALGAPQSLQGVLLCVSAALIGLGATALCIAAVISAVGNPITWVVALEIIGKCFIGIGLILAVIAECLLGDGSGAGSDAWDGRVRSPSFLLPSG